MNSEIIHSSVDEELQDSQKNTDFMNIILRPVEFTSIFDAEKE